MNKERVVKWDNIKFFMILSVVLGHTIYEFYGDSTLGKGIYMFIYTYHMPVFIFVAGLFSKSTIRHKRYNRVLEFVIIYLVMKFLDSLGNVLQNHPARFHLFWEDGPGWFAFAMAVFLLVTMYLQDLDSRSVFLTAVLLGCLAGLDPHLGALQYGNHFVAMRILVFYPVFLAGYYLDADKISMEAYSVTEKIIMKLSGAIILAITALICIKKEDLFFKYINFLKGKSSYDQFKMGTAADGSIVTMGMEGVLYRLLCYLLWALLIVAMIAVVSNKEHIYTWIGTRTMSIFIWHKFLIVLLLKKTRFVHGSSMIRRIIARLPHTYLFAAMCIATILCIVTAYFPAIRIPSVAQGSSDKKPSGKGSSAPHSSPDAEDFGKEDKFAPSSQEKHHRSGSLDQLLKAREIKEKDN